MSDWHYNTLTFECSDPECSHEWDVRVHYCESPPEQLTCPHCYATYQYDTDEGRAILGPRLYKLGEEAA